MPLVLEGYLHSSVTSFDRGVLVRRDFPYYVRFYSLGRHICSTFPHIVMFFLSFCHPISISRVRAPGLTKITRILILQSPILLPELSTANVNIWLMSERKRCKCTPLLLLLFYFFRRLVSFLRTSSRWGWH